MIFLLMKTNRLLLLFYSFCLTAGLAAAIPRLDLFISLVGAFGCSFLGLIFPPLISLIVYWDTVSRATLIKNSLIIILGFVGFATGTYASIEAIIMAFSS